MVLHNIDEANFDAVAEIYAEGIETGKATFETNVPSWSSWDDSHFPFGRIAAYITGNMLGWASLSPVSSRCVYAGVAEVSVYVSQDARGKGVGKLLLESLIDISEENGIWTLQSGIF
ncbi:MAG: GNAT family N-acetyltransferase, partial [Saprospiraceae bacterium]|nr:GNAT family N-acetyltransferase [Saprospiraceae bacterium]